MDQFIIQSLKEYAERYETETFLFEDPSIFMHKVQGERNQELIGFIAAGLSYGRRDLFFPKIQYIIDCSHGDVEKWILSNDFCKDIPDKNNCYYRLYTNKIINTLIRRIKSLLEEYGSLRQFAISNTKDNNALTLIEAFTKYFNNNEVSHVIPKNTKSSCKRLCMFLRWMVRNSSPVDLGLWSDIVDKRTLIMPMDVHVIQEAVRLGLMTGKSANMKSAQKLTNIMLDIFPEDPLKGDFALFGYGVNH
jgi:uncharacterized protein (TIGR02757 family)